MWPLIERAHLVDFVARVESVVRAARSNAGRVVVNERYRHGGVLEGMWRISAVTRDSRELACLDSHRLFGIAAAGDLRVRPALKSVPPSYRQTRVDVEGRSSQCGVVAGGGAPVGRACECASTRSGPITRDVISVLQSIKAAGALATQI